MINWNIFFLNLDFICLDKIKQNGARTTKCFYMYMFTDIIITALYVSVSLVEKPKVMHELAPRTARDNLTQ
jgi:hypothetical protein